MGLVTTTACAGGGKYVTTAEFEPFKADVKKSGEAVDAWILAAHENIVWLRQVVIANHCVPPIQCNPPVAPPPPPDGGWGS